MEHARNFDEQNYDKSIVDYILRRNVEREKLVGKILRNHQSFVNFVTTDFSTANYLHYSLT